MRLGYLYSRYPVISQTFCDTEMLALERFGVALEIGSVYSPLTSLRHEHISRLRAPIHYAPPQQILRIWEKMQRRTPSGPTHLSIFTSGNMAGASSPSSVRVTPSTSRTFSRTTASITFTSTSPIAPPTPRCF